MSRAVHVEVADGVATIRLEREHGNAINDNLVDGLMTACRRVESAPEVRGVLLAASGKLFSPGLDLQELIELDRERMEHFVRRFSAAVLMLYTISKPVVAALHGHALAGGCVLALTADWRVLSRGAKIGLNEVRVGVPLPFGVARILQSSVNPTRVEEVALFGRNYSDEAAVAVGLAHELQPPEGFEDRCRERLAELAERDGLAFAVTKRYLRSATVERVRASDRHLTRDFLDSWFSAGTQQRIRDLVQQLRSK